MKHANSLLIQWGKNMTDEVYEAHKHRVLGDERYESYHKASTKPANNYDPDRAQGGLIEQVKAYANTSIDRNESATVRCGMIASLDRVCHFIAINEGIPSTRVYPAVRVIGYNNRYHEMKNDAPDPLYEIGGVTREAILTADIEIVDYVRKTNIAFDGVKSVNFRIHSDAIAIAAKDAQASGVKVSELNLYNTLEGLKLLVDNEPDYILMRDEPMFTKPLDDFVSMKKSIRYKWLGIKAILLDRSG